MVRTSKHRPIYEGGRVGTCLPTDLFGKLDKAVGFGRDTIFKNIYQVVKEFVIITVTNCS